MTTPDPFARATSAPDANRISLLMTEFQQCSPASDVWNRRDDADATRFCIWPGQNRDFKKRDRPGEEAFPWDGASDTRAYVADDIINERVGVMTAAFWRGITRPKAADDTVGQYAVALADYFVNTALTDELWDEVEMSAQYLDTYGWTVLNVVWEQKVATRRLAVGLQDLIALGAQLARQFPDRPELAELGRIVLDPTAEDLAVDLVSLLYESWARQTIEGDIEVEIPELREPVIRRAVRELRESGEASVPVPYLARNLPAVFALRPWDEVFVPPDTTDLQSARVIFRREWLTEADLRARVNDSGYDKRWVEEAVKTAGTQSNLAAADSVRSAANVGTSRSNGNLIEVLHAFYRAVDDDNVPGIYCTTFSGLIPRTDGVPVYAAHELVEYPHGQYPFVAGKRERLSRSLLATRGVPEVAAGAQREIKVLRDGIIDWTSIGVIPPVNTYKTAFDTKYRFGPAVRNLVLPGKEPRFMDIPANGVTGALATWERLDTGIANQFGLSHPMVPPDRVQASQARCVGSFLSMWSRALQQMVALAQCYMSDAEFARVTGAPDGWLSSNRYRIGVLSVSLEFDVRELNEELTMKRIEAVNRSVIPADVQGVVARNKWVELQLRAINPSWAKELVMESSEASDGLWRTVRDDIAQMYLGNAPRMVENDPTAQTKLQFAQQVIGANPAYGQALANGESRFAQLMEVYVKNLAFSVTQEKNKAVGRIGVDPEAAGGGR